MKKSLAHLPQLKQTSCYDLSEEESQTPEDQKQQQVISKKKSR
jgi:hypothetical protein